MKWNWQDTAWPNFKWDAQKLAQHEASFLERAGYLRGISKHLNGDDRMSLTISLMSDETLDSSGIEGETLNRESVQSSIKKAFGLNVPHHGAGRAEAGAAEMMVDIYQSVSKPLTHDHLYRWHEMLMNGRRDLHTIGGYRQHEEPMQIISGASYKPKVHFEAPPSAVMIREMDVFLAWLNKTAPKNIKLDTENEAASDINIGTIARAGVAHLWFETLHPFEDGNGRLGRAIAEKILAQGRQEIVITALAGVLLRHRKQYYQALHQASQTLNLDNWLAWFADRVLEAQHRSQRSINFVLYKTRLFDDLKHTLNSRQEKALLRMFAQGIDGFKGGMSAKKYMIITGASSATTTRDLGDLVAKGVLTKTGERKSTRYTLQIKRDI